MNIVEKSINFNSIVRVEYLDGYAGEVTEPRWRLLDDAKMQQITNQKQAVLCRLSSPNRVLNVENRFALGPYDTLFTLGNRPLGNLSSIPVYSTRQKNISNKLSSLTKGVLDSKRAGGIALSQYLCSDVMVVESSLAAGSSNMEGASPSRQRRASGGQGMAAPAPRATGGTAGGGGY